MMEPLISICIPTYNGEAYLRACIESVLAQTYTNFEVIVVDDQSTDSTVAIIESYSKKDPRIQLHRNAKNLGLVNNWNKCMELSNGEWIKFIFQDDYLELNCLEEFLAAATNTTPLLVSKRSFILNEQASATEKKYYNTEVRTLENTLSVKEKSFISAEKISKTAVNNIALNFIGEPSLTFFKKEVIYKIGSFNADLAQICDLEFFLRLASSEGLIYVPKQLCHFRIHTASTTSTNLDSKKYSISHLDPIVFVRQLLYCDQFQPFRSHLSVQDFFKLKNYLSVRSYEAKVSADRITRPLFESAASKFPELNKYAEEKFLTRLKYLLILMSRKIRKLRK